MSAPITPDRLVGRWLHAHEEDTGQVMVYRPADGAFPPSRGRAGFDLRPDGSAADLGPGADDRPGSVPGRWALEDGDRLVVDTTAAGGGRRALEVVSATPEALTFRDPRR
ncbi:hypothetical protein ACR9E3_13520 [Actinomycetospora sp. C-140]